MLTLMEQLEADQTDTAVGNCCPVNRALKCSSPFRPEGGTVQLPEPKPNQHSSFFASGVNDRHSPEY